jgi:hypothetical protein
MSVEKPRHRNTLWDFKIQRSQEVLAPIAAELAAFKKRKPDLLEILRKAHAGGPKSKEFDADQSSRDLIYLAREYFGRPIIKKETMPATKRVKRLRKLATAANLARIQVRNAMLDDVGYDLFKGWCAEANISALAPNVDAEGSFVLIRIRDEINSVAASLAALETAALKAVEDVRRGPGAPKGMGVLPPDYVNALEHLYRKSTGLDHPLDAELFAEFLQEFLNAIRQDDDVSANYDVSEARKYARKLARKNS